MNGTASEAPSGGDRVIRAVVFDFGRVISAQKPEWLFRLYEKDLGLAPGSINTLMFDSKAWREALLGDKSFEEFWLAIGPVIGLETVEAVHAFRSRYMADEAVNQEVLQLIRRLHGHYRLGVLSNSPPGLAQWLRDWKMLDLFDVVFCSGDEGVAKPDPVALITTLERLRVERQSTVFIDDAPENVEAARVLGIHSILFTDYPGLVSELEAFVDPDLIGG
jgi:putative hydrolase of the HAD superfamily